MIENMPKIKTGKIRWMLYFKRGEPQAHIVKQTNGNGTISRLMDNPEIDDIFGPIEATTLEEARAEFEKIVDFTEIYEAKGKRK
jgi:hypothetical protein